MTKKKVTTTNAAAKMTYDEALRLTKGINNEVHFEPDSLARFVLLLRWLAYTATDDERETLYIETEGAAAPFMHGVDEAIEKQMSRQLDLLRKGGAR